MSASSLSSVRRRTLAAGTAAVIALTPAGCGSSNHSSVSGMDHGAKHSMSGMPGMNHPTTGNGLADAQDGYRLTSQDATLPAGEQAGYRFSITGPDGKPVTDFALDQTKRMHFYAIRSDLTGFQHIHPTMTAGGNWTADLAPLAPGSWRMFASFIPGKDKDLVLSRTVTVPGRQTMTPLPAPAGSTDVDGYTIAVKGEPMAGMAHPLTVTITRGGEPVVDLQPYLDTYAHLTAFHEGDTAFAHLHPEIQANDAHGGPDLPFHAELASSGNWRLFLQFQTGGKLHTAALTLPVS